MDEGGESYFQDWAESIYWTQFSSIRFCQFLHGDFRVQLALPEKFAEIMKNKLEKNVLLRGPNGCMWEVGLVAEEDRLFFKRGWEEFVNDHFLAENDILMFKYIGKSQFQVLVFDRQNLCEKEASYFCKRWRHNERCNEDGMKRKAREASVENSGSPILFGQEKKRRTGKGPSASSTILSEDKAVRRRSAHKPALKTPRQLPAIDQARAVMKNESFLVIMRPTHVYKRFYLRIPIKWAVKHLHRCNQSLILRVKGKTWNTRYNYCSAHNYGGIATGWKKFAFDNDLDESDVCLFDLGDSINGVNVLDVKIFRADDSVPQASSSATIESL